MSLYIDSIIGYEPEIPKHSNIVNTNMSRATYRLSSYAIYSFVSKEYKIEKPYCELVRRSQNIDDFCKNVFANIKISSISSISLKIKVKSLKCVSSYLVETFFSKVRFFLSNCSEEAIFNISISKLDLFYELFNSVASSEEKIECFEEFLIRNTEIEELTHTAKNNIAYRFISSISKNIKIDENNLFASLSLSSLGALRIFFFSTLTKLIDDKMDNFSKKEIKNKLFTSLSQFISKTLEEIVKCEKGKAENPKITPNRTHNSSAFKERMKESFKEFTRGPLNDFLKTEMSELEKNINSSLGSYSWASWALSFLPTASFLSQQVHNQIEGVLSQFMEKVIDSILDFTEKISDPEKLDHLLIELLDLTKALGKEEVPSELVIDSEDEEKMPDQEDAVSGQELLKERLPNSLPKLSQRYFRNNAEKDRMGKATLLLKEFCFSNLFEEEVAKTVVKPLVNDLSNLLEDGLDILLDERIAERCVWTLINSVLTPLLEKSKQMEIEEFMRVEGLKKKYAWDDSYVGDLS